LRGELLRPEDDGYDATRAVFNGMIDKRPAIVVRWVGTSDSIQGVSFARTHDLSLSVHGGGHSVAGNAVSDGGLMLDLSPMKGIRVDPVRRTAQAQAGLTLGEFDHETQAFGLATTLGVVSVTSISGLTLGGGLGWLNGKHGLACDNLLSADVVTADGRLLTGSEEENEDLFWGLGVAVATSAWSPCLSTSSTLLVPCWEADCGIRRPKLATFFVSTTNSLALAPMSCPPRLRWAKPRTAASW
jgi:FAD/FMN-containing dehydrogenase